MKKTKIVCTIGPASSNKETLKNMIKAGMNVIRLNFSHINYDQAQDIINIIKNLREEMNVPIAIMLDTKGPEVRLYGHQKNIELKKNQIITIISYTKDDINKINLNSEDTFYTNLPQIGNIVQINTKVLIMDGFIEGKVISKNSKEHSIQVKLLNSGILRPKAHLSLRGVDYPLPFLSEKDKKDIIFAVKNKLDYIALSFVRSEKDIYSIRNIIQEVDPDSDILLISKIENAMAIKNIDKIILHSDGIMVARGDLGVELDIEDVPIIQKQIIGKCYLSGKPVITATQMLESMIDNPLPTRAEASDVANACFDLTSAVMLSGETAIGKYPVLVVETMKRIIKKVEESINYRNILSTRKYMEVREAPKDLTTIITYNALSSAYHANAKAIAVLTKSGYAARMISRLRSALPIYAFTYNKSIYNKLALNWGIHPFLIPEENNFEKIILLIKKIIEEKHLAEKGDLVVFVAGLPLGKQGTTNVIRIETIGKVRIMGKSLNTKYGYGKIVFVKTNEDFETKNLYKKIIVLKCFKKEYIPSLKYANGIVMENDDYEDELAILSIAYNIPVLLNAHGAFDQLSENHIAEISGEKGYIVEL